MTFSLRPRTYLHDVMNFCFPRSCVICGKRLATSERFICTSCNLKLPRTNLHLKKENNIEKLFWGRFPIERATGFMYYSRGSESRQILLNLKYYHTPAIGEYMGRLMAKEIEGSGFFEGIDLIIPIPLAKRRLRQRGYNQVAALAKGVSQVTGIECCRTAVHRLIDNPTQTAVDPTERVNNVQGIFSVIDPDALKGKHILLMDDVITTGATLSACGEILGKIEGVRISVLTLAVTSTING